MLSKNMLSKIFFLILTIFLLSITSGCKKEPQTDYSLFAQCLTEKGLTFYGAYWCSHCQRIKDKFGDAIRYIDYVECDPKGKDNQAERCTQVGIDKYATIIINGNPDQKTWLIGEPTMQQMANATGCHLPI
jgi:hypothetical protein